MRKQPREATTPELWQKTGPLARDKRHQPTEAENKLWQALRIHRPGDLKFRRQHAIGPYIVDFYCVQARLVLEIDGASHDGRDEEDNLRQAQLEARGLRVLRFTNEEVMSNIEAVISRIVETGTSST